MRKVEEVKYIVKEINTEHYLYITFKTSIQINDIKEAEKNI